MLRTRHMHLEVELLKWLALMVLAAGLAVLVTSQAGGGEKQGPPADLMPLAANLGPGAETQVVEPRERQADVVADDLRELNEQLWTVLHYHRSGHVEEALQGWELLPLPCEADIWRYVAVAAAQLQLGEAGEAAIALDAALTLEPDNPLVHYYLGILRLQQAETAPQWYDAPGPLPAHLVSFTPLDISPNTRGMYELAAMMELERAIELAPFVQRDQLLISPAWADYAEQPMTFLPPIVEDLLLALEAENFEGKAHNMLSYLCLDRNMLAQSEQHMDEAARLGLSIVYGYEDLGQAFEQREMYMDATRAFLKAMAHGGEVRQPGHKAWQNFRDAWRNLW